MKTHVLKCWPVYFKLLMSGRKTFEIRKNDRDFKEGDILDLREYDPIREMFTGSSAEFRVGYITSGQPFLPEGYCVMQLEYPPDAVGFREIRSAGLREIRPGVFEPIGYKPPQDRRAFGTHIREAVQVFRQMFKRS